MELQKEVYMPSNERIEIEQLFEKLCKQVRHPFPQKRQPTDAPTDQGVYIIREGDVILHVGRTLRGKEGLQQRIKNHLSGSSSFSKNYLKVNGVNLREGKYLYQYLVVNDPRKRALLEAYAVGMLCPEHLGLGKTLGNF